jgi:hypothetical protein
MTEDYEKEARRLMAAERHREASVFAWLAVAHNLGRLEREVHRLVEFIGGPDDDEGDSAHGLDRDS